MNHLKILRDATKRGIALQLVYDDSGHWAVSGLYYGHAEPKPDAVMVVVPDRKSWKRTPEKAIEWWAKQRGEGK